MDLKKINEALNEKVGKLSEGTYAQGQVARLANDSIIRIQVQDDSGGKTKWMNLDKEVVAALTNRLRQMGRKKK